MLAPARRDAGTADADLSLQVQRMGADVAGLIRVRRNLSVKGAAHALQFFRRVEVGE
jgi:hypothetical protein